MSKREQVLAALFARLATVPGAGVARNLALPEKVPAEGLVVLRDGDPGQPEVTLSPPVWSWRHRAEVEALVQLPPGRAEAALDALLSLIGAALAQDPTLGGLANWLEVEGAQSQVVAIDGAAPLTGAIVGIILHYDSAGPLA